MQTIRVFYVASAIEHAELCAALEGSLQLVLDCPNSFEPVLVPVNGVGSTPTAAAMVLMEVTVLPDGPTDTTMTSACSELMG